jgi:hypothetical protein
MPWQGMKFVPVAKYRDRISNIADPDGDHDPGPDGIPKEDNNGRKNLVTLGCRWV